MSELVFLEAKRFETIIPKSRLPRRLFRRLEGAGATGVSTSLIDVYTDDIPKGRRMSAVRGTTLEENFPGVINVLTDEGAGRITAVNIAIATRRSTPDTSS